MLTGFDISHQDWQSTPLRVQLADTSLQHQLRTLEFRYLAQQHQIKQLKALPSQVELLTQQLQGSEQQLTNLQQVNRRLSIRLKAQQKQLERFSFKLEQSEQERDKLKQQSYSEAARLKAELANLRELLDQNSSNSHLPPSADQQWKRAYPERQPSGRKPGAQAGHRGKARRLLETADHTIELRGESCTDSGALLLGVDPAPARRQVTELLAGRALVTEYRQHRIKCLSCGMVNRAVWPAVAAKGAFGAGVQTTVAYLTGRLSLSHRDTVEALQSLFEFKIGLGSVSAIQRRMSCFSSAGS